jgi:hypothetical protein
MATHPVEPEPLPEPQQHEHQPQPNPSHLPVEPEFGPMLQPAQPEEPGVPQPEI